MPTWTKGIGITLVCTYLVGCGVGDRASEPYTTVRDSAGIRVVENSAPSSLAGHDWRVADNPSLQIGVVEGDSLYMFARIVDALRLTSGSIVVADAGSFALRYFDSTGTAVATSGRQGAGPGEFEGLSRIEECMPDSVFASDFVRDRIAVFDRDGAFVRQFSLSAPEERSPARWTCDGQGMLAVAGRGLYDLNVSGAFRPEMPVGIATAQGEVLRVLGTFPGDERYRFSERNIGPRPFGRTMVLAAHNRRVFLGAGDGYEVSVFASDGTLSSLIRRTDADLALTEEHLERYREARLAGIESAEQRRQRLAALREMEYPATVPAYASLLVDGAGRLWVERYRRPGEEHAIWSIFDPGGAWIGALEMPEGFEPFQVGNGLVLGRWEDERGVDYIRLYELQPPD